MSTQPMQFTPTLPPEEVARANFYGLLARLFYAPPEETLLRTLAASAEPEAEEGGIGAAWSELAAAAADADADEVREEYETAFVGVGKAPVTLYTSAYSVRYTNEMPLAELRGVLAGLGLGRRADATEPEDHIAALLDVMRFLIADQKRELDEQKAFFERWIWPTIQPLCAAIEKADCLDFYKRVARLLLEVCTLEHRAFEML
jgi:TorA maturation chaperone TorD